MLRKYITLLSHDIEENMHIDKIQQQQPVIVQDAYTRQKIVLQRILFQKPAMLIINIPFLSIDSESQQILKDFMEKYARSGGSVLYSSPNMHDFIDLCDRVITFANGNIIAEINNKELLSIRTIPQT